MSRETFELIEKIRSSGRRAAMATLVRTHGTTPRKEGTKMFVGEGGAIFGSVTIGGCVDAKVIEQADDVLRSSKPRRFGSIFGSVTIGGCVDARVIESMSSSSRSTPSRIFMRSQKAGR